MKLEQYMDFYNSYTSDECLHDKHVIKMWIVMDMNYVNEPEPHYKTYGQILFKFDGFNFFLFNPLIPC